MVWYVALGGALGSVARCLLGNLIQERAGPGFPLGTLVVNVTGSLLLGFLAESTMANAASREVRVFLTAGLCGGYTTFSTFSLETVRLLETGDHRRAALNVAGAVVLSLLATAAGLALGRWTRS